MRRDVTIEERTQAIQKGVRLALREHALLGHPVCIWRDEKVVWLTPEEVLAQFGRSEAEYEKKIAQDHHD